MGKKLKEDEKIKTNIPDSPFEDEGEKDGEEDIEEMLKMDYKTMMGVSNKQPKKVTTPQPKKPSIVDNLKEEFGDKINEGPAYEYGKVYMKAEKAYLQFQKAIDELGRFNTKHTGEKVDQKILEKQWKKQVVPFYKLMKSWISGKL
ncbi:MAG: hypothetical protein H8D94_01625 [Candidatus Pelagibacter sp.]|nr:hypothetical protein [Candidatus Pelagibacter sp.]